MEAGVAVATGLAVLGSRDLLTKMLGPTADYVGGEMKGLAQKCNVNLGQIFAIAQKKLGSRMEQPGVVSPRVLKEVLNEGMFCEDMIVADYYGGVLASSKSDVDRDDRGVAILGSIKSLSVYQLRLHYLFYWLVYRLYGGKGKKMGTERQQMKVYIPISTYLKSMEFKKDEEAGPILIHSVEGLVRSGLVEGEYHYGGKDYLAKTYAGATEAGLIMAPSMHGAEVFLWGQGIHGATGHELVEGKLQLSDPQIQIADGAIAVGA